MELQHDFKVSQDFKSSCVQSMHPKELLTFNKSVFGI